MSLPWGRWELSRSLRHAPPVVDGSVRSCASETRGKRVSIFPIGAMGTFEVSVARTSCSSSERQTQWCKRESKQARQHFPSKQARQHFPSGRWEVSRMSTHVSSCVASDGARVKGHCGTPDCDTAALQTTNKIVSLPSGQGNFPSGRWELLSVSTHIISCIACDGAR